MKVHLFFKERHEYSTQNVKSEQILKHEVS